MGFGNGYDSGYSDAIEDVRNGKVAGVGPTSGDGGSPTVRAPGLFYLNGNDDASETTFDTPEIIMSNVIDGVVMRPVTVTLDSYSRAVAHVAAPTGGWVPGDAVIFRHNNSGLAGIDRGDMVPDDDTAATNIDAPNTDLMLIRRTDRWSLVPLTLFG